jgi:hypothetical protein
MSDLWQNGKISRFATGAQRMHKCKVQTGRALPRVLYFKTPNATTVEVHIRAEYLSDVTH